MVADRIKQMNLSVTVKLADKVADMRNNGIDIIGFNQGEPDFDTPISAVEACIDALKTGKTHYSQTAGLIDLRKAIADKLLRDNEINYFPEDIVISIGAKQALFNAIMAICNPGDEIILPVPCWVSYLEMIKLAGGRAVYVDTKADHSLDIDLIRNAITDRTKAIVINTPNNPTGAVYSGEELRKLGQLAVDNDFYIISDEVYEKLVYDGHKCVSPASISPEIKQKTITINGFSKAYAMTGWRLGYSAAPADITSAIIKLQGHVTFHNPTFTEYGAIAAVSGKCDGDVADMVDEFNKRRDIMYEILLSIPDIKCEKPDGAFYMLPDVSAYYGRAYNGKIIHDSVELCEFILDEAKVAVVPGAAFMSPDTIRIAYSNSEENIIKGMNAMKEALAKLG